MDAAARPEAFRAGLQSLLVCTAEEPELALFCLEGVSVLGAEGLACRAATTTGFIQLVAAKLGEPGNAAPPIAIEMVVGGVTEVVRRALANDEAPSLPSLGPELVALWAPLLEG